MMPGSIWASQSSTFPQLAPPADSKADLRGIHKFFQPSRERLVSRQESSPKGTPPDTPVAEDTVKIDEEVREVKDLAVGFDADGAEAMGETADVAADVGMEEVNEEDEEVEEEVDKQDISDDQLDGWMDGPEFEQQALTSVVAKAGADADAAMKQEPGVEVKVELACDADKAAVPTPASPIPNVRSSDAHELPCEPASPSSEAFISTPSPRRYPANFGSAKTTPSPQRITPPMLRAFTKATAYAFAGKGVNGDVLQAPVAHLVKAELFDRIAQRGPDADFPLDKTSLELCLGELDRLDKVAIVDDLVFSLA
jgi:hypothetical protein